MSNEVEEPPTSTQLFVVCGVAVLVYLPVLALWAGLSWRLFLWAMPG